MVTPNINGSISNGTSDSFNFNCFMMVVFNLYDNFNFGCKVARMSMEKKGRAE